MVLSYEAYNDVLKTESINNDDFASLSDQIMRLTEEVDRLRQEHFGHMAR